MIQRNRGGRKAYSVVEVVVEGAKCRRKGIREEQRSPEAMKRRSHRNSLEWKCNQAIRFTILIRKKNVQVESQPQAKRMGEGEKAKVKVKGKGKGKGKGEGDTEGLLVMVWID